MALKNIFVMHGPNLNLLGEREAKYYGSESLADINNQINEEAKKLKLTVEIKQSNSELEIIELIQHTKLTS